MFRQSGFQLFGAGWTRCDLMQSAYLNPIRKIFLFVVVALSRVIKKGEGAGNWLVLFLFFFQFFEPKFKMGRRWKACECSQNETIRTNNNEKVDYIISPFCFLLFLFFWFSCLFPSLVERRKRNSWQSFCRLTIFLNDIKEKRSSSRIKIPSP